MTLVYCGQTVGRIKIKLGTQVGLGPGHIVLDRDPAPLRKGAQPPIFGPYLLWSNGWMDQDSTWHGGEPWSRPHCARWGPSSTPQKGGTDPQFTANFYCGQTAGCIMLPPGMEVGLGHGYIVLDGDPAAPPPKGHSPQFWAHICCGQMAGWIKTPFDMELGLGPGNLVLDGNQATPSPNSGRSFPIFGPCLMRPNGSRWHLA